MRHNLLVFAVLLLGTSFMLAQIPQRMSYQGRLTDAGGAAVANGNYSLTFALYDTVTAGSNLWTETQPTVAVTGGVFSVSLGSVTPISLPFNQPYWLGISVQGGAELSPRTALTSSPYSAISKAVLGSNNVFTSGGNVGIGTTTPNAPLQIVKNSAIALIIDDGGSSSPSIDSTTFRGLGFQYDYGNGDGAIMASYPTGVAQLTFWTTISGAMYERMRITSNGSVGIGLKSPLYRLDLPNIAGTAGQGRANAWTTYSSRRWKENIKPITGALEKVERLRGVSFDWKMGGKHDIGLIAEEVGEVVPEVVSYEDNGKDAKSLEYARLVAVLIQAVKELNVVNKELSSSNKNLETRLAKMEILVNSIAPTKSVGELRFDEKNK